VYEGIRFTNRAVRCLGLYIGHDKTECYNGNWLNIITKLKNCMHVWKSRKLTLYGKIAILKSLGISMLVYNFAVLDVPTEIVKDVNRLIYNFVWNKTERIKRKTLINDYENGGIKMVDIESMIDGLKAAWIPRLVHSKHSSSFLCEQLNRNNIDLKMLLDGNVTDGSQYSRLTNVNSFYINCITAFNKCKTVPVKEKMSVHDFLAQPLWCNKLLTNKGCTMLYKHWISSGFRWIKDLYDENGVLLADNVIYNRLSDKRNWMSELSIVRKVIGKSGLSFSDMSIAKHVNIQNDNITFVINNKRHCIQNQKCKFFYKTIVDKKSTRPYVERSWEKEMCMKLTSSEWCDVYMNRIHNIPIKKVSEFMYKIMQKLTVSRQILKKWNQTNTDLCPVCNEIETVNHIYFECNRVNEMWKKLGLSIKVHITWKKILFGFIQDILPHKIRNLLFSIVLYCLFKNWVSSIEDDDKYCAANIIQLVKRELKNQTFFFKYSNLLCKDRFNMMWENIMTKVMEI
jgi:hypothetical protein